MVLIDVDSLRADHVSHLGYSYPTASGLDALRGEAALFTARAPSSATLASSGSLLTGVSPPRHGLSGPSPRLAPEVATLAERLGAHGFRTVGVSHHFALSRESGLARGFESFESVPGPIEAHPDASVMLDWLREWLASRKPSEPFFLYLHPTNLHSPYKVPASHRATLLGRPPSPAFNPGGELERAVMGGKRAARRLVGPVVERSLVEQYDTAVRYTLDRVGEMLELLDHDGSYRGSLVIVVGNHGEELFDHGGFGHGATLYEEVLRVPVYLKLPGRSPARSVATPVSLLDVVPSVLDVLGLPREGLEGRSLAGLARGEPAPPGERAFPAWLDEPGRGASMRALLSGRYKLIDSARRYDLPRAGEVALYDLALDPGEQSDVAANASALVEHLRGLLDTATRPD